LQLYVHAARNLLIDVSQKIKACKHQAKMAKIVANATKSLRESVAAEKNKTKAPAKNKKKEVRFARKRTADPDPE
jgi:hypothetical protein